MAKPLFDTSGVHAAHLDEQCSIVDGAIVSRPLLNTDVLKQVLFAMDAEQELSEHHAPFIATVQVLAGRLDFNAAGQRFTLRNDGWIVLPTDTPHSLTALEPTRFLLTLVKESGA